MRPLLWRSSIPFLIIWMEAKSFQAKRKLKARLTGVPSSQSACVLLPQWALKPTNSNIVSHYNSEESSYYTVSMIMWLNLLRAIIIILMISLWFLWSTNLSFIQSCSWNFILISCSKFKWFGHIQGSWIYAWHIISKVYMCTQNFKPSSIWGSTYKPATCG